MLVGFPLVAVDLEVGPPDTVALAMFSIGVFFLVRNVRAKSRSDLLLAGLALGLAAGSLWYYASATAVLVVVWAIWRTWHQHRRAARPVLTVIGLVALCSGFWLLRNWIGAGDPVYPLNVRIGGLAAGV